MWLVIHLGQYIIVINAPLYILSIVNSVVILTTNKPRYKIISLPVPKISQNICSISAAIFPISFHYLWLQWNGLYHPSTIYDQYNIMVNPNEIMCPFPLRLISFLPTHTNPSKKSLDHSINKSSRMIIQEGRNPSYIFLF